MTSTHRLQRLAGAAVVIFTLAFANPGQAGPEYELNYHVDLTHGETARVRITLPDASAIKVIDFNLDEDFQREVTANGKLKLAEGRARWQPPARDAQVTYKVNLNHERDPGEYDSIVREDFAIFRGDDLIPPASVTTKAGAESRATLRIKSPTHWSSVNSGWPKINDKGGDGSATVFRIDDPDRRFDRPTGWMIGGELGTRREWLEDTQIAISAPTGNVVKRLDILSFIIFNWPTLKQVVGTTPPKILMVGAGKPMWRGGLSGPNSLFIHADRPMVSENGTSTLIHELFHTLTRISGADGDDWIAEGLAEYYSYAIVHRAGGMTDRRRERVTNWLRDWSGDVENLRGDSASGKVTARAALLFDELDDDIRDLTDGRHSLDDATRRMIEEGEVSLTELREIVEDITGSEPEVLDTPLLND